MKRNRADGGNSIIELLSDSEEDAAADPAKTHVRPPAAKRARSSKAGAGAAASRKAAKPAAKPAAKQISLKSKGFGALFLNASQGGDDGHLSQQPASTKAKAVATKAACNVDDGLHDSDAQLWVDKHAPKTAEDLAVHKAKVTEVKEWLEGYLAYRKNAPSRVLLVTGPAGCGKSSTVRALAADLCFDLVEWTPPVPMLWSEHQYQNMHDLQYHSKLDDFESFVARSKFASLQLTTSKAATEGLASACGPSSSPQAPSATQQRPSSSQPLNHSQQQGAAGPSSQQPGKNGKLLLVDDLPYVHDAERRQRLVSSLRELAATSRCPVVIIATDGGGGGGKGGSGSGSGGGGLYGAASGNIKGLHKDVLSALESMGASTISFNPLTALNTAKALKRIAEQEGVELLPDTAAAISVAAAGDLRNAIGTLQMGFAGTAAARHAAKAKAKKSKAPSRKRGRAKKGDAADAPEGGASASHVARDLNLSLFHALGKILHHKRQPVEPQAAGAAAEDDDAEGDAEEEVQPEVASTSGTEAPHRCSRQRGPLGCDPDAVVQQSTLEATTIASFLQENYPHFISDDAIDDVAEAASYLSDAVLLACHRSNATTCGFWDEDDAVASTLQDAAAATVAARGLIYANAHPAPSRWLPLRGPASNAVERAATTNAARLSDATRTTEGVLQCRAAQGSSGHVAAYVLPFLRLLAPWPSHAWLQRLLPRTWSFFWNGTVSERTSAPAAGSSGQDSELAVALQVASLTSDDAAADGGEWDEIEDD